MEFGSIDCVWWMRSTCSRNGIRNYLSKLWRGGVRWRSRMLTRYVAVTGLKVETGRSVMARDVVRCHVSGSFSIRGLLLVAF